MRDIFTLFLHAMVTIIRLGQPAGLRSVVAESVLMRHQVLILNRGRKRTPNLRASDRIIAGLCTLLMRPARVLRPAVVLKTSTLLHFHKMLIKQKDRLLFSPKRVRRPRPKGPTKELIDAAVEMKRRNRRVLASHPADPRKASATGFVARAAPSRRKRSPKPQRSTNAFGERIHSICT